MDENLSQALFSYGYLCNESNGYTPDQRPQVSLQLSKTSTIYSPKDELTLSVVYSKDVFKVEYYYNWHYIGSTTDSTGGFAYIWKPNLPTGKYLITAKAYNIYGLPTNPSSGAEKTIDVVKTSTGINPENKASSSIIYPNPAHDGSLKIRKTGTEDLSLTIFDMYGKVVFEDKISDSGNSEYHVNIKNVASGVYLLQIKSDTESESMKWIIN